ncbi:MAG: hypothetical protein ACRCX4_12040 [Bacteroidales bacterium]
MNGYIKVTRELIWGSLRKLLSASERYQLIELMTLVSYRMGETVHFGYRMKIDRHEICISTRELCEKMEISRNQLRALLKKLELLNIASIRTRNIFLEGEAISDNLPTISPTILPTIKTTKMNGQISSVTLCQWVFSDDEMNDAELHKNERFYPPYYPPYYPYLKEYINNNIKKNNAQQNFKNQESDEMPLSSPDGRIALELFRQRKVVAFDEWWELLVQESETEAEQLSVWYDDFCEFRRKCEFNNMTKNKFTTDFLIFVSKKQKNKNRKIYEQPSATSVQTAGDRQQVVEEIERARQAAADGDFTVTPEY